MRKSSTCIDGRKRENEREKRGVERIKKEVVIVVNLRLYPDSYELNYV